MVARDERRAQVAQLVRRCTLSADPALIDQLAELGRDEAIATVLDAEIDQATAPVSDESDDALGWWLARIHNRSNNLQDRMAFLWHSIIPSHRYSVGAQELVAVQLNMIRANALGNFRTLLHNFVVDGALLRYLNADRSTAKKPNENLARELMELFTVGIGHYSEADVRSAALAMTGWRVDKDSLVVSHDAEKAYDGPVTFLGETGTWDVHSIVDRLVDHPATPARISSMVWYHFTGKVLDQGARGELGAWWQGQNLEIKPLVDRIVRSEAFWVDHYVRPRTGFEYYSGMARVLNVDADDLWRARSLGQLPYEPPNVGGWAVGDRWLGPDSVLRRGDQVFSFDLKEMRSDAVTATVDQMLDACGLWVVSDETRSALESASEVSSAMGEESVAQLRWRVALTSPEFQLQ